MDVTVQDWATPPRIRIDTTAETVWRVGEPGGPYQVRGVPQGGVLYDAEVPQLTPVHYTDGASTSAVVELPDVGVWLIPAADPDRSVPLLVDRPTGFSSWSRAAGMDVVRIPGRAAPVAVTWARQAREGTITVHALDRAVFDALAACLDVGGPYLLSAGPRHWPAQQMAPWVVIGDVEETPAGPPHAPRWLVKLPLVQIDRPAWVEPSTVLAWEDLPHTWAELAHTWPTLAPRP